jgi:enamine deaminase RidA (YjgF/YER057c/UK114 family)
MSAQENLKKLGITLPEAPAPVGSYVPGIRTGHLIMTSGQLPFADGALMYPGHVGAEVSLENARECAKTAALNALAIAAQMAGGLDKIKRVVRVAMFVASAPGFHDQPKVANGASDLLVEIFGGAGRHVRAAVGVNELPLNSCVEVELTIEAA